MFAITDFLLSDNMVWVVLTENVRTNLFIIQKIQYNDIDMMIEVDRICVQTLYVIKFEILVV